MPQSGPTIIVCNHPMAFTEACLLACFTPRSLYFLVRGDVFIRPWIKLLQATHQIPVYRFRDGFGNLRKNASSFNAVHQHLKRGRAVLLFPEANTKLQMHLSPLQKGAARIAQTMLKNNHSQLKIVPVGITYSDGLACRSEVFVNIGPALSVDNHDSSLNEKEWLNSLTKTMESKMKPLLVHVEMPSHFEAAGTIMRQLSRVPRPFYPIYNEDKMPFMERKNAINTLNNFGEATAKKFVYSSLYTHDLNQSFRTNILLACLISPLAAMGWFANAIPFYGAKFLARKRVGLIEFITPVRIGIWMLLELIYLGLLVVVGYWLLGLWSIPIVAIIPLLGIFTLACHHHWLQYRAARNFNAN